jgi:hypothetical protein
LQDEPRIARQQPEFLGKSSGDGSRNLNASEDVVDTRRATAPAIN